MDLVLRSWSEKGDSNTVEWGMPEIQPGQPGQLLAVSFDGDYVPADNLNHSGVSGVQGVDGPLLEWGREVDVLFDKAPGPDYGGHPVFLGHNGEATLMPPTDSGTCVFIVGIVKHDTRILFQPQFLSIRP